MPRSVFLGSNYGGDEVRYEEELRRILDRLAPRPTLLFTVTEYRPDYSEVNDVIRRLGSEYDNVTILDWQAIAETPGVLSSDRLHPTESGREVLAQAVAGALGPVSLGDGACLKSVFRDDSAVKEAPAVARQSAACWDRHEDDDHIRSDDDDHVVANNTGRRRRRTVKGGTTPTSCTATTAAPATTACRHDCCPQRRPLAASALARHRLHGRRRRHDVVHPHHSFVGRRLIEPRTSRLDRAPGSGDSGRSRRTATVELCLHHDGQHDRQVGIVGRNSASSQPFFEFLGGTSDQVGRAAQGRFRLSLQRSEDRFPARRPFLRHPCAVGPRHR